MDKMNQTDHRPDQPDNKLWSALLVSFIIIGAVVVWGLI